MECIDKGDIVGTLFLDFRKAFDLVDHKILMDKLSLYHFSPSALRWFDSYLDGRHQAILSKTVWQNLQIYGMVCLKDLY